MRLGSLHLLGHIDRVLEPDHREEGERGGDNDAADGAAIAGFEFGDASEVSVTRAERPAADADDDQQPGHFHTGEQHIEFDALADATQVDRRDHPP